ncbi:MAG TPA: hypothetical protein VGK71_05245, partial [Nitrospirota bacterium]
VAGILMGKRGLSEKDALLIARMTGGRVGDALSADAADLGERRAAFLKVLGEIAAKPPSAVLRHAEAVAKEDSGLEDFTFFGTLWFRDLLVILVGGGEELAYNRDMADELGRWTAGMTPYRCEEALTLLRETGRALERTFNRRLVAEDLFFRLREEVLG